MKSTLVLWLYSVIFVVHGQVDNGHQSLLKRMTSLEYIVQSMTTEFGTLRQKNSELEYKYQILTEEFQRFRLDHTTVPSTDEKNGLEEMPGYSDPHPIGPVTSHRRNAQSGAVGSKGDKGDRGPKGDAGTPGFNGDDGLDGLKGDRGEKGDRGTPGSDGFNGDDGLDGRDGVKGEPGPAGPAGPKGVMGFPGYHGNKGMKGDLGAKGDTGVRGVPGPKGDTGMPGIAGPTGAVGRPGHNGSLGPKGDKGSSGSSGYPGSPGNKGEPGIRGERGFMGYPGQKGEPGQGPQQKVAFSARLANAISVSRPGQTIVFGHTITNIEDSYDSVNGYFRCRTAGLYFFYWSTHANPSDGVTTTLNVNGSILGFTFADSPPTHSNTGSNAIVTYLNVGDIVSIRINCPPGMHRYLGVGSSFSGILLN
ncbi:complement C1q and tumor necrosis factor-related protein 9-like isoform X1 [Argopecten irradians]|uniref:complement C1q and tumor necrosis factor-related protein 9-like isoform X1 n=2 Tax=Argopecten irradians TaxID=31199 RepID=UPI003716D759